jgi:acid stress-induced BolA-like protein IbaG/YrbA
METIMRRVQKALQKEFPHQGIALESAGKGMVGGWVISKSFEGLSGMERQQKVRKLFEKFLDENDRAHVAVILTFTPLEKRMMFEDDFDDFAASSKRVRKPLTMRGNGIVRRKTINEMKK